jgi:hypothetical protein
MADEREDTDSEDDWYSSSEDSDDFEDFEDE